MAAGKAKKLDPSTPIWEALKRACEAGIVPRKMVIKMTNGLEIIGVERVGDLARRRVKDLACDYQLGKKARQCITAMAEHFSIPMLK